MGGILLITDVQLRGTWWSFFLNDELSLKFGIEIVFDGIGFIWGVTIMLKIVF